jgi:hypothetical protein
MKLLLLAKSVLAAKIWLGRERRLRIETPLRRNRLLEARDRVAPTEREARDSGRRHRLQLRRCDVGKARVHQRLIRVADEGLRLGFVAEKVQDVVDQVDHELPLGCLVGMLVTGPPTSSRSCHASNTLERLPGKWV